MNHIDPFLKQVAAHYYQQGAEELSKLRFIFPSKRALSFFRHHLSSWLRHAPSSPHGWRR